MKEKGPTNIENMLVLPFNHTILLRGYYIACLAYDLVRIIEIKCAKFRTIITSDLFEGASKLAFDIVEKGLEMLLSIRFWLSSYFMIAYMIAWRIFSV